MQQNFEGVYVFKGLALLEYRMEGATANVVVFAAVNNRENPRLPFGFQFRDYATKIIQSLYSVYWQGILHGWPE